MAWFGFESEVFSFACARCSGQIRGTPSAVTVAPFSESPNFVQSRLACDRLPGNGSMQRFIGSRTNPGGSPRYAGTFAPKCISQSFSTGWTAEWPVICASRLTTTF